MCEVFKFILYIFLDFCLFVCVLFCFSLNLCVLPACKMGENEFRVRKQPDKQLCLPNPGVNPKNQHRTSSTCVILPSRGLIKEGEQLSGLIWFSHNPPALELQRVGKRRHGEICVLYFKPQQNLHVKMHFRNLFI